MNAAQIAAAGGALLTAFMMAGRWSVARITGDNDSTLVFEPRTWAVVLLLALAFRPDFATRESLGRRGELAVAALMSFLGYFVISSAWAPDWTFALAKALELGLVTAALAATARLARATAARDLSENLWRSMAIVLAVFALLGLSSVGGSERMAVLGGGPNVFGRNMAVLAMLCVDSVMRGQRRGPAAIGLAVATMLVLLSGSRGAIVALALGVLVLVWCHRVRPGRLFVAGLALIAVTVLVVLFTNFGQAAFGVFQERVIHLTLEEEHDSGRSDIYAQAIALGWTAPLYGDGLAGFAARGYFVYPHNLELEAFAEGGLVGVALLLLALWRPLGTLVQRPPGVSPMNLAAFVALLGASQVSGDFFDSRGVMLFGLLAVLEHAQSELRERDAAT